MTIGPWCSGNIGDFESLALGSIPSGPVTNRVSFRRYSTTVVHGRAMSEMGVRFPLPAYASIW